MSLAGQMLNLSLSQAIQKTGLPGPVEEARETGEARWRRANVGRTTISFPTDRKKSRFPFLNPLLALVTLATSFAVLGGFFAST